MTYVITKGKHNTKRGKSNLTTCDVCLGKFQDCNMCLTKIDTKRKRGNI